MEPRTSSKCEPSSPPLAASPNRSHVPQPAPPGVMSMRMSGPPSVPSSTTAAAASPACGPKWKSGCVLAQRALNSGASLGRSLPKVRKHSEKERPARLSSRSTLRKEGSSRHAPPARPTDSSSALSACESTSGGTSSAFCSSATDAASGAPSEPSLVKLCMRSRRFCLAALTSSMGAPLGMGVSATA